VDQSQRLELNPSHVRDVNTQKQCGSHWLPHFVLSLLGFSLAGYDSVAHGPDSRLRSVRNAQLA
jgi:hypothetical protein